MNKQVQLEEEKKASYPYSSLEAALRVAEAVKSLGGASKSLVSKPLLASHLKEDERGQSLVFKIASAKAFGLIEGRSNFTLSELARNYYFPTNEKGGKIILLAFLAEPRSFKAIIDRFDGSQLPDRELLGNIFHRELGVPESWKQRVAAYFDQSAKFAGAIDEHGFLRLRASMHGILAREDNGGESSNMNDLSTEQAASVVPEISQASQPRPCVKNVNVWQFGPVRVETPAELSRGLWEKLEAYVKIVKPEDTQ